MWTRRRIAPILTIAAAVVVVVIGVSGAALLTHTAVELGRFARADARRATFIHAAGQPLVPGVSVRAVDLAGTLARLKYVETRASPTGPGQFRRTSGAWDIALRSDGEPRNTGPGGGNAQGPDRLRLELRGDRIARVLRNNQPLSGTALEGEVLTGAGERSGEDFRPVRLAEVPMTVLRAFLAAEDHRFYEHRGLDLRGLVRAAWANARAGRVKQGGSTITQQLVKNRLLTPRRTFLRKLDEAWLATVIDWRYPKERILEGYLNEIYLGQRGPLSIRGVGAAARAFFGKEVHQLTLAEGALLAGITRAPNSYSPTTNPGRARERRDAVLARMRELGWINETDQKTASAQPVRVRSTPPPGQTAPYFTDLVQEELEQRFGDEPALETRGVHVVTSLDVALQRFAEAAVARGLDRLETRYSRLRRSEPGDKLQAALIALDPATGHVRALAGGRDYIASQFNRATLGHRQPGSAFKPFVYAAALGVRASSDENNRVLTAASLVDDTPIVRNVDGKPWSPRNYEDRYEGRVSVRRALVASLNAATLRVADAVGLDQVVATAQALGIDSHLDTVPAVTLGAFEVTPLELARAYLPFANGGLSPRGAATLTAIHTADGTSLDPGGEAAKTVLSPAGAYLMTSLLGGVIDSGTATAARGIAPAGTLAGKTGTTNDARDAWFVGYAPNLLAIVWVGFDDAHAHGLSGAEAALPIWMDFMRQALDAYPASPFPVPPGITFADIDTTNGKLANRYCPAVARETFLAGTEPPVCTDHGGPVDQVVDWWRRFRNWIRGR